MNPKIPKSKMAKPSAFLLSNFHQQCSKLQSYQVDVDAEKGRLYWTLVKLTWCWRTLRRRYPIHEETIPKCRKITTYIYLKISFISLLQHFKKGKDLVRPGITHFATSFYFGVPSQAQECLLYPRKDIITCLKAAFPFIKVLWMANSIEKLAMVFIYEAIGQAKEKIQSTFNGVKKRLLSSQH